MIKIKRVGVLALAKVQALVMLIFGLILTVLYTVAGGVVASLWQVKDLVPGMETVKFGMGADFAGGFLAGIMMTVAWTIMGFIAGAVGALLYNLAARWAGGIEIEVEKPLDTGL